MLSLMNTAAQSTSSERQAALAVYTGAAALLTNLPSAQWILADRASMKIGFVKPNKIRAYNRASLAGSPEKSR